MKTTHHLLTLTCIFLAVTAHSTPLQIDTPSTVTITGRLMSPSHGWNWTMSRAGSITVKNSDGTTVAEKVWTDFDASNPSTYAARDTTVTTATVSKILTFTLSLDAGAYDLGAVGSYSQAAAGYLWIDVATEITPSTLAEVWTAFDEMTHDWHDTTDWSPTADTIASGQTFTQSKTQIQEWRRGERSSTSGAERGVENYFFSRVVTQTGTGTKQKTVPVISWAAPSAITYGTPLSPAQLNATADVPGTFVYSPDTGTVLNAGEGQTLTAYFTPDDGENFSTTTATQSITVNKAATTLAIASPTSPATLPIDSTAALTVALKRDHDGTTLSTASVTYEIAETRGAAAATLSMNQVTMTGGNGDDTLTICAQFPGNANHLPSSTNITFRVPRPGSLVFTATPPLISPVTLPSAFLHSEHGATTSTLAVQISNPGELPVEITQIQTHAELGEITSFSLIDENGRTNTSATLAAGQNRNFKIVFRPARYDLNRDAMRIAWRCRPNISTVSSGQVDWTLEGIGLAPRMATVPFGSTADATNPRDLQTRWPALRSQ